MQRIVPAGYEADFALWAESQAAALRDGRFADLDLPNLSEEIDALGRRDRRELRARITTLAVHVLKLLYQPERASGSWRGTIVEQATRIGELLEDSPSLVQHVEAFTDVAYGNARRQAAAETGLPIETFPPARTPEFDRAVAQAMGRDVE
jgi:hypothetical protein